MGGLATLSRSLSAPSIKSSAGSPAQGGFLPLLGATRSATGIAINQASAMAEATVHACIVIRSADVARCTPALRKEGDARSSPPVTDHAVAKVFKRPNWIQTWFEFAQQMQAAFLLRKNAYAAILRDGRGRPINLIPINPDAVQVLEASNGQIFYLVNRVGLFQMFALAGLPVAIPAEDMLHLRGLSFNMLFGVPTIELARDSIGVALGLGQQAARLIGNGARPGGVLQTDKTLSDVAAKRLSAQWERMREGLENVGRTAILEEGLKWNAMQLSSVDQQFIEQRRLSVEEAARWWGVPLYKLSVTGELAKIKVDDAEQVYVNTVVMPDVEAWEQKLVQTFDLDKQGLVADLDERKLIRASESVRVNNQRLRIMSGISTQNECRAENGDPPMDGGDVLLHPVNLAASGSDMSGTAPDAAGRPADGTPPDPGAANQVASEEDSE